LSDYTADNVQWFAFSMHMPPTILQWRYPGTDGFTSLLEDAVC